MFVYYILENKVCEMEIQEISEIFGKSVGSINSSVYSRRIVRPFNVAFSRKIFTLKDRVYFYNRLKLENEIWKEINKTNGKYLISNYGRIKKVQKKSEKLLLTYTRKEGTRHFVKIKIDGKIKTIQVDHTVAEHFIRKKRAGEVLIHKNGINDDNHANNLSFQSQSEFVSRFVRKNYGKKVVHICSETRRIINEYDSAREAGRNTHYSYQAICDYCNKKHKNHYGEIFMWRDDFIHEYGEDALYSEDVVNDY